jgi:hypothetical protein
VTIELPNNDIARAASKGVDRRTLLKAGAWAAPVLVLTTAAPAMAASTSAPITVAVTAGTPTTGQGKTTWTFTVTVTNPAGNPAASPTVYLSISGATLHSQTPAGNPVGPYLPTVAGGGSATSAILLTVTVAGTGKSVTVTPQTSFSGETFPVTGGGAALVTS